MITRILEYFYWVYAHIIKIKKDLLAVSFTLFFLFSFVCTIRTQTPINGTIYKVSGNQACDATSPVTGIPNVSINIFNADTNTFLGNVQSDNSGTYNAIVSTPNIAIEPSISGNTYADWIDGITTFDIVITRQHMLERQKLLCPFQRIAADVNNDGSIGFVDTTLIEQLILGIIPNFTDVPNWRFVSKNYTRTDSGNRDIRFPLDFWNNAIADENGNQYPFRATYDYDGTNTYDYNSTSEIWMDGLNIYPAEQLCNTPNWDFYAVKSGDVSQGIILSPLNGSTVNRMFSYIIEPTEEKKLKGNSTYQIEIMANSDYPIVGFQLGLNHSNKITIQDISPNNELRDYNKEYRFSQRDNLADSSNKEIRTLWIEPDLLPTAISQDLLLFSLIIQTNTELNIVDEFLIDEELMDIEFISIIDNEAVLVPATLNIKVKEL